MIRARLLIALAVACFALALALRAGGADRALFLAINDAAWRWVPAAALSCVTILGHGLSATMLLAPTLLRTPNFLVAGLYATPVALLLSRLPKALIDSPRPAAVLDPASIHVIGMRLAGHNSFPSGHAITAFLVAAVLLAGEPSKSLRAPVKIAVSLVAFAVALSRVAVGAHWPSDALAGAALGLIAGVTGAWAQQRWPIGARAWARPLAAAIVLACSAALAWVDLGYPSARPLQWVLATLGLAVAAVTLWRLRVASRSAQRLPG
jgi:membrane-associated phospholipid phosphatase